MGLSSSYPTTPPALNLDFINTTALDPRVTFSRSTTAPYYDGKTSVLAEQNLVLQSQTFGTSWIIQNATQTANSITAPDGTSTGTTLTSTSSVSTSVGAYQSVSTIIGSTLAIYAKVGTSNFIGVTSSSGGQSYANFNLNTGVVSSSSNCTASIINAGNGWYRCVIANTTTAGTNQFFIAPKDADPSGNPWQFGTCASGNYVYIWGAQLEQRSSVTAYNATTTTPITNYIPQLLTAPINAPRFDFNPTTGESLGLLIEQSSTNLLIYSEQLDNTIFWLTGSNTAVLANQVVAPDGNITGDQITVTSASNSLRSIDVTVTANTTYTFSQFVKRGTSTDLLWSVYNTSAAASLVAPVSYYSQTTATGWARCTLTFTTPVGCTLIRIFPVNNNAVGTVFIWGAQLEALPFATSYIPTTSAQVTRASDNASMTGTNFSSWFNQGQGTFYAEYFASKAGITAGVFVLNDTTISNRIEMRGATSGADYESIVVTSGTTQADLFAGAGITTATRKNAFSYATNNFADSLNGATPQTDTTGSIPNVTQLIIGSLTSNTNSLNGTIKKIAYYPQALTSAQLQSLTGS